MNLYYYKYKKYKQKYLNLINQQYQQYQQYQHYQQYQQYQQEKYIYTLKNTKQLKYMYDEYIQSFKNKNPMYYEPIVSKRVVTIDGIIYDSVYLFKCIINENNKQIISDNNLEMIYHNVKCNYDNNISNTKEKISYSDFNIFNKIIPNKVINNNNCYCYVDYSYNYLI